MSSFLFPDYLLTVEIALVEFCMLSVTSATARVLLKRANLSTKEPFFNFNQRLAIPTIGQLMFATKSRSIVSAVAEMLTYKKRGNCLP